MLSARIGAGRRGALLVARRGNGIEGRRAGLTRHTLAPFAFLTHASQCPSANKCTLHLHRRIQNMAACSHGHCNTYKCCCGCFSLP
eukprot:353588-Chlamydomonas_euryale.AAC.15